jgi:aryl-alcohol dehydrogenase-like predicted oxidoreductase
VEAFADALREQVEEGRIASFGVSNWTLERFEALVGVLGADAHRLVAFSNHFSLATMVTAPWPGCLAMTTEDIATLGRRGVTTLAWASLARGFFAGRDDPSWESDDNQARRRRGGELAGELGTTTTAVGLAYVLHQPDHLLAVVGTRSEVHIDELVAATALTLSAEQIAWLEGGRSDRR